jgi:hypothetical protein
MMGKGKHMKTRFLVGFTMAVLVFGMAGTANATLVTFDSSPDAGALASGTNLTDQYASWGVNFSAWEDGGIVDALVTDAYAQWDGNSWMNDAGNLSNAADVLRIDFDAAANNVSLYLQTYGSLAVTFDVYGAGDVLLETQSVITGGSTYEQVVFASSNITYIEGLQPSEFDDWFWAMDDLSFDAVPEPASMLMLGCLSAGLAGARRIRRKK